MHNIALWCVVMHIIYNMLLFYIKSKSALPYIIDIPLLYTEANMIYCMAPIICNSSYHVKHGSIAYHRMWYGAQWHIAGLVLWIRLTMNNNIPFSKCVWHVIGLDTYNKAIFMYARVDKAYNVIIQPYH